MPNFPFNPGLVLPRGFAEPMHASDAEGETPEATGPSEPSAFPATSRDAATVVVAHDTPLAQDMAHLQVAVAQALTAHERESRAYATPIDERFAIGPTPFRVRTHGRRFNAIFVAQAINIQVNLAGLGTFTSALTPGWNQVDWPEGTEVTWLPVPSSSSYQQGITNAVFRATNDPIAGGRSLTGKYLVGTLTYTGVTGFKLDQTTFVDVGCFSALLFEVTGVYNSGTTDTLYVGWYDVQSGFYGNGSSTNNITGTNTFVWTLSSANGNAFPPRLALILGAGGTSPNMNVTVTIYGIV